MKMSAVFLFMIASASSWAKECSELLWSPALSEKYPNVATMCQRVIDKDGQSIVQMKADFIRTAGMNNIVLDIQLRSITARLRNYFPYSRR